jgi:hypothetical protein
VTLNLALTPHFPDPDLIGIGRRSPNDPCHTNTGEEKPDCQQPRRRTIFRPTACRSSCVQPECIKRSRRGEASTATALWRRSTRSSDFTIERERAMRISRRSAMVSGQARMRQRGMVVADLQQEDGSADTGGRSRICKANTARRSRLSKIGREKLEAWQEVRRFDLPPNRSKPNELVTQGRLLLSRYAWRGRSDPGS